MVTLLLAASNGCMQQFVAIGANAGLPAIWHDILEQAKVLRDHARQQPVLFFGHPLSSAGHHQGSSVLVCGADLYGDQCSRAGCDRRALYQKFDGGVADGTVVTKAVAHTNKLICIPSGESLCAVLIGGVCLGNAKRGEIGVGCFHAAHSTGKNCEA